VTDVPGADLVGRAVDNADALRLGALKVGQLSELRRALARRIVK